MEINPRKNVLNYFLLLAIFLHWRKEWKQSTDNNPSLSLITFQKAKWISCAVSLVVMKKICEPLNKNSSHTFFRYPRYGPGEKTWY
jgi:hypothetical protein